MKQHHSYCDDNNNDPVRRRTAIESKISWRFITTIALPTILLILTFIAAAPINPAQATGGAYGNETAATPAPGGASLGPAANETNVTTTAATQSACLPQNATTGRPAVDANATTTTNNTTATVAPSGASIGANDTSTSLATAENTTTNNTTATVAPSGASIC
jgi:hypothetical protein